MLKARFSSKDLAALTALLIFGVLLTIVVIIDGFPRAGYDSVIFAKWYRSFAFEFHLGDLYPRWLRQMNAGLGSPVLFFYPPIAYWLTAPFEAFCNDLTPWCQLGLVCDPGTRDVRPDRLCLASYAHRDASGIGWIAGVHAGAVPCLVSPVHRV